MATTKTKNPSADSVHQIPPPRAAVRVKEEPLEAPPAKKPQRRKQSAAAAASASSVEMEPPSAADAAASSVEMGPPATAAARRLVKTEPCTLSVPAIEVSRAVAAPSPSQASTATARAAVEGNAQQEPVVLKAMADLRGLSSALSTFNLFFDELQLHLESIKESIAKKLDELDADKPQQNANLAQEQPAESPAAAPAEVPEEAPGGKEEPPAVSMDAQPAESSAPGLGGPAELLHPLEVICQTMNGKTLRKYVATHLNRIPMLREEIPDALLRFAPDPALLTLNSLCRFFLQGSKAYADKNSKMVTLRRAAVRILEFFILADCPKAEDAKAEAEASAVLWRSRLFREGGVACACYEDAVGLVLFLAAYRLASVFEIDDLGKLVDLSMLWKKVGALRRSPRIREFIQDIIERMLKNDMHVQAITLLFRFDLKDKFDPESLLSSFLNTTVKSENIMKEEAQGSPEALKEGCKRTLSALKLVVQCVNEFQYKSEQLSNYKIDEKIASLEKDIVNFASKSEEEKISHKRKAKELGSSENTRQQSVKRNQPMTAAFPVPPTRYSENTRQQSVKHNHPTTAAFPVPPTGSSENTRQQSVKHNRPLTAAFPVPPTNAVMPSIQQTLYDEPTPGAFQAPPTNIFVNPNFPGLLDGYSAASAKPAGFLPDGNAMGLATGNTLGTFGTIGTGIARPAVSGIGPYPVVGNLSPLGNSSRLSTDGATTSYGWNREVAFNSPSNRQSLLGGFPPSAAGQSLTQPLMSTAPSFSGRLHRNPDPDLYGFADMVLDGKSYQDSASHLGKGPEFTQPQAPIYHQRSYY
ncbi:hypothetical protein ACLOJK_009463 [Asimina triloba]